MLIKRYILSILFACVGVCAYAQTDTIRYVKPTAKGGSYLKSGLSWDDAKDKVQDAINDLRDYMDRFNLKSGSVYIAAGQYVPTESTESTGGSMLNTSFKIYSGIHVYGGFNPDSLESKPGDRIMANGKKVSENWANQEGIGTTSGTEIASQWDLRHKTVLSGNHATTPPTFVFDSIRGRYNTAYPASSFHVVWFATGGKFETTNDSLAGHYKPLVNPASIDGCVISSGNASSRVTTSRDHTAYGGGVYMVGNTSMRACIVERCNATLRGGGIYADGGGSIEFCMVQLCQVTGVGVYEGYGGGVCIDYDGSIGHSHLTNCAARCGGGLAITHILDEYPWRERLAAHVIPTDTDVVSPYSPFTSASVINNNTAAAEGGGIYLVEGGTVNHATVTGNNCIGPDVTYYGRRHGRSGGIYVRDCGMIFNSVFWGNRCATNNDIQFASVRQKEITNIPGTGSDAEQQVFVYHSAFMNHDITDWTGATKEMVFTLDKRNMPYEGANGNYPCFFDPTVDPNNWQRVDTAGGKSMWGPGVFMHLKRLTDVPGPRIWHLTSYSAIDQKGVQVSEAVQNVSFWLKHAHTEYGVVSNPYEPSSTLGALVRKPDPIVYSLIKPQGLEGRLTDGTQDIPIPTLFVDPKRKGVFNPVTHEFVVQDREGNSWDTPLRDLGEAVEYFRKYFVDGTGKRYYKMPKLDEDGFATGEDTIYRNIQILVKEGTLTTVGPGNYVNKNLRSAAIVTYGHMRFYGGYPSRLDTTKTEGRNVRDYRTMINSNVTGVSGAAGYENNSAHVFALVNADSVIIDGFMLQDANTHNVYGGLASNDGGGVVINNSTLADSLRIDMVGNQLRNCVVSNCTSPRGAGIFVNGEFPKGNGNTCYAELKMVNTIVRNNSSVDSYTDSVGNQGGVITANGRAFIQMDHCDVANNVGHALRAGNIRTAGDGTMGYRGYIRMDNSFLYCNGDTIRSDHSQAKYMKSVNKDGQTHIFGTYNMFDKDLAAHLPKNSIHHPSGFFENDYEVPLVDEFVDGLPSNIETSFRNAIDGLPRDSASRHNECLFTREDVSDPDYPVFVNPSRNIGHSTTGDKPLYGGKVQYSPINTNPVVNAANPAGHIAIENYDRSDFYARDRGGAPDIGAIEDYDLPAAGKVIYVTPDGAGRRDGSSWDNAIAGNTVYMLSGVAGPALASGDQIDPIEGCDRVLDGSGNPRLTTDILYCGGWGKVFIDSYTTGGSSTDSVTNLWTREDIIYSGGPRDGETESGVKVFSADTVTISSSAGGTPGGWTARWHYDSRYPYGEISGGSRSFWRANPYHADTAEWNNASDYSQTQFINACNANGWINNTRAERYVSGLQYAVEKASATNKTNHNTDVQVWVGAGRYTDYKGYVMRDSVAVYGGFPYGKFNSPGMSERQALMSDVISIPKSLPAQDFEAVDYETILQISDTLPKNGNTSFNVNAVKYWDDDYELDEFEKTRNYFYKKRVITDTFTFAPVHYDTTKVTSTYIKYADMTGSNPSKSICNTDVVDLNVTDGVHYYKLGEEGGGKDCWHMSHPDKVNYIAYLENNNTYNNNCSKTILKPADGSVIEDSPKRNWIMVGNGSLTDLNIWQTMPDVPAGTYLLSVDMACQYKNKYNASEDINTYFYILNGTDTLARTALKAPKISNRNTSRLKAFRHVLRFETSSSGDITIKLVVGDGWRNTKANNATYGTDTGVDPDSIPCYYVGEKGTCEEANKWGTLNPNARELWLSNLVLEKIVSSSSGYYLSGKDTVVTDTVVADPKTTEIVSTETYTASTHRTSLRKRVLTMPDICVPTYGAGSVGDPSSGSNNGKFGDNLAHTHRVTGSTKDLRTSWENSGYVKEDPNYIEYSEVYWDGFTIRHGFLYNERMAHGGGAGVNIYEGAHLRNSIVVNNIAASAAIKGGGIFCDGATSTIEGCFVLNNSATQGTGVTKAQIFAGGMFMYEGTCFNSLFANNFSFGSAGGLGFCVGKFYNNTIAYNTCDLQEGGEYSGGAISLATASSPNLFVANTIIFGNNGIAIRDRATAVGNVNPFLHCYLQSAVAQPNDATNQNVRNWTEAVGTNYGINNVYKNGENPSADNTPFEADFVAGVYTPGNAAASNDFRLRSDSCINKGTEDFGPTFFRALRQKGQDSITIVNSFIYKSVDSVNLPQYDVAFADRVQDCQIDMGAYEYNAAYSIKPDTTTHPGQAIFYISFSSPGGDASSSTPYNSACMEKLQKVLDAAGRYKYALIKNEYYNNGATPVAGKDSVHAFVSEQPNKYWTVEVWMQGDTTNSRTKDSCEIYTPTRSTKYSQRNFRDNTLDYSFIVPHGVIVRGGFSKDFYHFEDEEGNILADTTGRTYHAVDEREPLYYRTVLSGKITSSTGAEGNTYHVVTFTNNLFDAEEKAINGGGQLDTLTYVREPEKHRVILDGLFIEDGHANAPDEDDRIGAAAVVPGYAHIRNCVLQNNAAESKGGALYLQQNALVSGCIIKKNSADLGGGVYFESPEIPKNDSLAHIYTSSICENTASTSGGGIWFDNTYARVNSSVLWQNNANDNANVSGTFSRSSSNTDYPFNFCAVESRRLEGQANILLSPQSEEGARWDRSDPFDTLLYYPITLSSTLARAGMTYKDWDSTRVKYPSLDSMDIAGIHRSIWNEDSVRRGAVWTNDTILLKKNNDFIDIGARALNKSFIVSVEEHYVMRRLYVMHTDLLNSDAALALQQNTNTDSLSMMYKQMGSCILNPFHRLGDAFDYIIATRRTNPAKYRNARFEVFVEQGTYYPYHNAYGEQDQVRTNTFLIPEGTTIIGGINSQRSDHYYGQSGFEDKYSITSIGNGLDETVHVTIGGETQNYILKHAVTDSIRLRDDDHRPMRDINLNSVIEPWELARQTILSGNAVSGDDFTHVYHVVTIHADSNKVGPQPYKFKNYRPEALVNDAWLTDSIQVLKDTIPFNQPDSFAKEHALSILARTIEFDGIQITGGHANQLEMADAAKHPYHTKTYFRGGAILVDGNWTESFDSTGTFVQTTTMPAKYNIPILVQNCYFTDNMAGNGGAIHSNGGIYLYGSHFTQNYSQGPMNTLDQQYIPWSAGGCIATNAFCGIANTLFANNEAKRGLYQILIDPGENEYIPDADARQGFGGVLSVAKDASLRMVNCQFMKNKAVAYSSVYNFLANNHYTDPDSMQLCFNTIFWGNEVFNIDSLKDLEHAAGQEPSAETESAFREKYKASRAGVFHYDGELWDKYEELYHRYDSMYVYYAARKDTFNSAMHPVLDSLRLYGDSLEGMFFCSYRLTYGPKGMKPTKEGYLLKNAAERAAFVDPRKSNVPLHASGPFKGQANFEKLFTYLKGNNNTLINRINTATDGPNFRQPSYEAGIDGYMQNADWLQSRITLTTDQGWGTLSQTVGRDTSYFITKFTEGYQFETRQDAKDSLLRANPEIPVEWLKDSIMPVLGLPKATFDDLQPSLALYNLYSRQYSTYTGPGNPPMPLGDQYYMTYTSTLNDTETTGVMNRISRNPRIGETDVYIDLGIYEYQNIQLDIDGQEIDTVWVATSEKGGLHDGMSWETPTTDMQWAIDLLMSSHNNHDKYICLMNEEDHSFSPSGVLDNRRAFVVSSVSLSPLMPDSALAGEDYGVKSLNFLGGYSFDVANAQRDPVANPTLLSMPDDGNPNHLNQLLVVEDMTSRPIQANWMGVSSTPSTKVIPVTFDGITFINPYSTKDEASDEEVGGMMNQKGGAAIYYRWQRQYEGVENVNTPNMTLALYPDSVDTHDGKKALPKLTISNCIFMDNGDASVPYMERSPAVRIDHGGGSSLIVNSLFHSNAGAPIYARTDTLVAENNLAEVPNDVVVVNSTFALNGGHVTLESEHSQIHNSLIWLDDLANDTLVQLEMLDGTIEDTLRWDKNLNKEQPGIAGRVTNNAVWGCFRGSAAGSFFNDSLVTDNTDVFEGPCFQAPNVEAATTEERRAREFLLNPGVKTMNKADTTLYRSLVFLRDTSVAEQYCLRPNGFRSVPVVTLRQDSDLNAKHRLYGKSMERGAYECRAALQRVVYVQPTLAAAMAGDGSSWATPFGHGQLQKAMDAAAVYTYLTKDSTKLESRRSYVYVKGTYDAEDEVTVIARDGVSVFGSLPGNFNDEAYIDTENEKEFVSDGECRRFVNYVRAIVPGVASSDATPTRIHSLRTSNEKFEVGVFFSGFIFDNSSAPDSLSTSPLIVNDSMTIIRNCIFTGYKMKHGVPVADMRKGLLYNNLFYGDTADVIVKIGRIGLALNNTVVAAREGDIPIDTTNAIAGYMQLRNNIALWSDTATCFAPYMTGNNPYALPAFLYEDNPALAYQLHENSRNINGGTNQADLPAAIFGPYRESAAVNDTVDRDILGNPRIIDGTVDNGAFETWRVRPKTGIEITGKTKNELIGRSECLGADSAALYSEFMLNYGGNRYPHMGSVVYLMDSSVLSMDTAIKAFNDVHGAEFPVHPGYFLLKPGASLYSNGHGFHMDYLAVEKRFKDQRYSMTALPYNYDTANIVFATYDDVTDALTLSHSPLRFKTYQYSGAARSAKDYNFQTANSSLWLPVDTATRTATDGYLMDFGRTIEDTVLRFTAFRPTSESGHIYRDDADVYDKIVYLKQYDNRTAGTGTGLNFTRQEDMGWNMKGLPWLVSDYRTDTLINEYDEDNFQRQMFIPHVLYQMNGSGEYEQLEDKIYSARSWDRGTTISVGNAFFTQTATTKDKEAVYFHLPYYDMNAKISRPLLRVRGHNYNDQGRRSVTSDLLTVIPDSTVAKDVRYTFGRDAVKWMSSDNTVQLYLLDSKRMGRISLLGAAPTEVDIPVGISTPAETDYTFSLPEKDAFSDYGYVWLIDNSLNRFTNLLDGDYTVNLKAGEDNNRFALRIGGYPKTDADGQREYVVYTYQGTLFVRGLVAGDRVSIYSPNGHLVHRATTSSTEWSMKLYDQSGFVVKVNDKPYKVLNL